MHQELEQSLPVHPTLRRKYQPGQPEPTHAAMHFGHAEEETPRQVLIVSARLPCQLQGDPHVARSQSWLLAADARHGVNSCFRNLESI
jgi:hypothetical protein